MASLCYITRFNIKHKVCPYQHCPLSPFPKAQTAHWFCAEGGDTHYASHLMNLMRVMSFVTQVFYDESTVTSLLWASYTRYGDHEGNETD